MDELCWYKKPHSRHTWGSPLRFCPGIVYLPTEAEARGERATICKCGVGYVNATCPLHGLSSDIGCFSDSDLRSASNVRSNTTFGLLAGGRRDGV